MWAARGSLERQKVAERRREAPRNLEKARGAASLLAEDARLFWTRASINRNMMFGRGLLPLLRVALPCPRLCRGASQRLHRPRITPELSWLRGAQGARAIQADAAPMAGPESDALADDLPSAAGRRR